MLWDDHSDYKCSPAFPKTSSGNAASAIIDWVVVFGAPKSFISDVPTHFKNNTPRRVSKDFKFPLHFTLPYCPSSNGAIKRLGMELLRVLRAVVSELQMYTDEWPEIFPLVQSTFINFPSTQRRNLLRLLRLQPWNRPRRFQLFSDPPLRQLSLCPSCNSSGRWIWKIYRHS